jgi:hypothetical protein
LFVFSNIVSSQQTGIFSPFVFNNLQASLVYFGAPFFSSPWLRQYKLTLFISMTYIFTRFCISTANPFFFYNIVSNRGLLQAAEKLFHAVILSPFAVILRRSRRIFVIPLRVNSAKSGLWTPMGSTGPQKSGDLALRVFMAMPDSSPACACLRQAGRQVVPQGGTPRNDSPDRFSATCSRASI